MKAKLKEDTVGKTLNNESPLQDMANKLRHLVLQMTTEAGSGHATSCMSCAEIMSVIFFNELRFNPMDPFDRGSDMFVMSKGHCAPILYACLKEACALEQDLMSLRKFTSVLEGHPTPRLPWVKLATGSLGQGLSAAAGIAYAKIKDKIDRRVYCLLGDGEAAEGSVWEAAQFASFNKLNNLCAIVDVNRLGQSGATMFQHDLETYAAKFSAFGWNAIRVNGHSVKNLIDAFKKASACKDKPSVLIAKTTKGKGVSFLEDKDGWHGKPLKKGEELDSALSEIPVQNIKIKIANRSIKVLAPLKTIAQKIETTYKIGEEIATREAYGFALARLGTLYPNLYVLDGDTKNSTFSEKFKFAFPERFVESYIAEQNMIGVAVGLQVEGKIPCSSTFACFLTRAYDFVRMAAYSRPKHLILCGSHAGVSIGEDGPSQMGLEDLSMMRSIQDSIVVYPSDAVSTEKLVEELIRRGGIGYIRTTRPKTKVIYKNNEEFILGGSKTIRSSNKDKVTLVGAGVTLYEAVDAYEMLAKDKIKARVIDLYSIKPIDAVSLQKAADETGLMVTIEDHYQAGGIGEAVKSVLKSNSKVHMINVNKLPQSGKPQELLENYGISAKAIYNQVKNLIK